MTDTIQDVKSDAIQDIKNDTQTIINLVVVCVVLISIVVALSVKKFLETWKNAEPHGHKGKKMSVVPTDVEKGQDRNVVQVRPRQDKAPFTGPSFKIGEDKATQRILLVSDNLPFHEIIIRATLPHVIVVPVSYNTWTLQQLREAIRNRAGSPSKQYASVGLLDHGKSGEFCLLENVAGGSIEVNEIKESVDLQNFLIFLASYVQPAKDGSSWKTDLNARVDLMGCNIAAGSKGAEMMDYLENLTKVNWAGSSNHTGGDQTVAGGSDWVMETEEGLGSIIPSYFYEDRIQMWTHHAGFFTAVGSAVGGSVATYYSAGMGTSGGVALGGAFGSVVDEWLKL